MQKNILLIITGSIAAYKSAELIRLLIKSNYSVTCLITQSAKQFITPLTLAALSNNTVYEDLFSLKEEVEMGHITLSRQADIILVAPASANIMAKMATGLADDLASTVLLASNKPIILAPAMNIQMWHNKATIRNINQLVQDRINIIAPEEGELACKESGNSRMAQPANILNYINIHFSK
ncbi:MAG: flavoprotein [Rickettsiales endosymbiont of Dermacentor nuttalli]